MTKTLKTNKPTPRSRASQQCGVAHHRVARLLAERAAIWKARCAPCRGWGVHINLDNPWCSKPCEVCNGTGKAA